MVVQHNMQAMNTNRMLGITTGAQAKSTEKLSSGYRINRAADDAAGLSISEKMRKQIRGLTQASANAQDGISCVQTAEGALTEVHSMLQRMNELSVQAGNGTMSEDDRQNIQDEIDQLITEIDRVSETTKFNETYLLKGTGKKTADTDSVTGIIGGKKVEAAMTDPAGNIFSGTIATDLASDTEDTATITYKDADGNSIDKDVTFKVGSDAKSTAANLAEAISKDKDLSELFTASSDAAGKLTIESKLDGTEIDNTTNAVTNIAFKSAADTSHSTSITKADGATSGGDVTAAKGESYSITLNSSSGALADGESITIGGKTYTYCATVAHSDPAANTFSTVADLQKLLGPDYSVDAKVTMTKTDTTYGATTADIEGTKTSTVETTLSAAGSAKALSAVSIAKGANTDLTTAYTDGTAAANATVSSYSDSALILTITKNEDIDNKEVDSLNLSFQVGSDTTKENKIDVEINAMDTKTLGISKVKVTGEDSTNADKAVNTISDAIKKVSSQRSALGAIQNRLEHTIANLDNVVENTTAAESAIRDTDMAAEMVNYSKNNILAQAGQSMLAQANQSTQGVLSLLQ